MKLSRLAILLLSVCAAGSLALAQDAAQVEKGKAVIAAASPKCSMCHSIAGQGNAKHPLDGVGSKLSADDIKAWVRTPTDMAAKAKSEAKPPMMAYPKEKISDADLDALVAYLMSLKAAPAK